MRKPFALLLLLAGIALSVTAQSTVTPETLLSLGLQAYRNGDFVSAVTDLQAAAQGFLSPEQMQSYVNTGKFERLQSFESALVYLALAQFRLGREDDARETILRLMSAERISPMYASLPIGKDASEFEALATALVPSNQLPKNVHVAADDPSTALPPITRKPDERVAVKKTLAEEKAERQQLIDEMVSQERERIQREADARIAAERANAQQQIATIQSDSDKRIAEAEAEARQRVAAAEAASAQQIDAAKRTAAERAAAAEAEAKRQADARVAEIQKVTEQRIAEERAAAERSATARVAQAEAASRREYLLALRTAEAAVGNGNVDEAVRIYSGLVGSPNAPREVLAEAAVGLYRVGAFREAVEAFRKFGTFARGEEDLRYYHAVALYETGNYEAAQKELACALPFIQMSDDVQRYRSKIENTVAQQAKK